MGWVAQALASSGREAILVVPQGTRVVNGDPEYHDWGPGANWETALAEDLRDRVDDRYRTVVHRNGRAIVGLSAGGYGASIIGLHRPETYAAIQSWSGYFHPTDPSGTRTRSVGTTADNDDADVESAASIPAAIRRRSGRHTRRRGCGSRSTLSSAPRPAASPAARLRGGTRSPAGRRSSRRGA